MQRYLKGKNGIVTAVARGIGSAISHNLASKGANLILNFASSSSTSRAADLARELAEKYGIVAVPVEIELGQPKSRKQLIEAAREHLAKDDAFQIDTVVNNAGIRDNKLLQDIDIAHYKGHYRLNVLGPLLLIHAALPYLPTDRSGRIINVSSVSSSALEAMTRMWSRELAGRATVNALKPGPVSTEIWNWAYERTDFQNSTKLWLQMTPLAQEVGQEWMPAHRQEYAATGGRPGDREEVAGLVGMLASPESAWCTSSVASANGGMRLSH